MDIVKRALLGDKKAQQELTGKGELLPCHICGNVPVLLINRKTYVEKNKKILKNTEMFIFCHVCEIKTAISMNKKDLIKAWNTRPQILTDEEMERLTKE